MVTLPPGYSIGMRIKTNRTYAITHTRAPGPLVGTIVNGSKGNDGAFIVKFDEHKHPRAIFGSMFDLVEDA